MFLIHKKEKGAISLLLLPSGHSGSLSASAYTDFTSGSPSSSHSCDPVHPTIS